jgi:energy-coupling factor transporter ATP-binding protein EcfA2
MGARALGWAVKNLRITIKNYRGFTDQEPAVFEIGQGFTALLGRNNAGKSSAKLLFYELRNLFPIIVQMVPQNSPGFFTLVQGSPVDVQYPGVTDPEEIFNNKTGRPITIEFEVVTPNDPVNAISRIVLTSDRAAPSRWRMIAFRGQQKEQVRFTQQPKLEGPGLLISGDGRQYFDMTDFVEVFSDLHRARYYGPFRNAINVGATDYFDLKTGTAFIDLWDVWKTSGVKSQTRAIGQVTEDIRRLFEFGQLEINASKSLHTLMVTIDGHAYRLAELGSGIAQFIIVLGNAATTKPSIVLVDEPETNLHPSLQIDFLLALAQYATVGCVFSTHSVGLARSVTQRIFSFQKSDRGALVRPFETTPNYIEFLGELSFSTFKEMGHDRLLLVEGVHDVKAMQQLLRLVHEEHSTVILPLGGNQFIAAGRDAELNELKRLSSNIYAIIDSERTAAGAQPSEARTAFVETCGRLGIHVCLTERRAIENYFTDKAVKAALGNAFSALEPYQALREAGNGWSKSDNWKIARQMTVDELSQTDLGKFIQDIKVRAAQ